VIVLVSVVIYFVAVVKSNGGVGKVLGDFMQ